MNPEKLARLQEVQEMAIDHAIEEMEAAHDLTLATKEERGDRSWLTGMAAKSLAVVARIEQYIALKERPGGANGSANTGADPDEQEAAFVKRAEAQLNKIMGRTKATP